MLNLPDGSPQASSNSEKIYVFEAFIPNVHLCVFLPTHEPSVTMCAADDSLDLTNGPYRGSALRSGSVAHVAQLRGPAADVLWLQVVGRTKLLKWIMGRIKPREFDSTKQYVSELLSILLQGNRKNQETLASMGGVDSLLQVGLCCIDG